ncbi:MAG TPA: ATP-binding protein [Acidimicrobiales bacterium]|nr:ATP-binding protein [Acidimicrobiales bacterium]
MRTTRTFPNDLEEIGSARRFVSEVLSGVEEEAVEETCLMVSELATNCVLYTSAPFAVQVDHTQRTLRIEVSDHGVDAPVLQPMRTTKPGGRGIRIVELLADDWGVIRAAGRPGKLVWFTLALAEPA